MRSQRRPAAEPRSNLPRRARSLEGNDLGPDGARALALGLEKRVGLLQLKCAADTAWQPTPANPPPSVALAVSAATSLGRRGRVRLHRRSRRWSS